MDFKGFSRRLKINDAVGINSRNQPTVNVYGDVIVRDQVTGIIEHCLGILISELELEEDCVIDTNTITVVDASEVSEGNYIFIKGSNRIYQGEVIEISSNDITLDTPLDYSYPKDSTIEYKDINLAVDGSTEVKIGTISPPPNTSWDITKINIIIEDDKEMDTSRFGGISSLNRAVVLRKRNENYYNIFSIKNNGDLAEKSDVFFYHDKAPSGIYGLTAIKRLAGQGDFGTVIRLDGNTNERLEVIIQSDLSGLERFCIPIHGHIVKA